jgi:uncharacterized protein (TIGR03067 family)
MYACFLVASVGVALFLNPGFPNGQKTDDAKNIQGTWKIVALTGGVGAPSLEEYRNVPFRITAEQLLAGNEPPVKYRLDPSKKPKVLDAIEERMVVVKDAKERKKELRIMPGIYELDGDDLKICIGLESEPKKDKKGEVTEQAQQSARPKEFKGSANARLLILKRDK